MSNRLTILPDPAFAELKDALSERMAALGKHIHAGQFGSLVDPLMCETLRASFVEARAHEGTVWLLDEAHENLVPCFNTGPHANKLLSGFKQPLSAGLICMVFASEQPFLENEVPKDAQQSRLLDSLLQTRTYAMIAVPFRFLNECRGVVSCVQLQPPGHLDTPPPGFRPEDLAGVERATAVVSRLIEFRLLGQTVGWGSE